MLHCFLKKSTVGEKTSNIVANLVLLVSEISRYEGKKPSAPEDVAEVESPKIIMYEIPCNSTRFA